MSKGPQPETVVIYPTGTHYIPGVPAIEQEVSRERADELLAYRPAAFTTVGAAPVATTPEPAPAPDDDPAEKPKE